MKHKKWLLGVLLTPLLGAFAVADSESKQTSTVQVTASAVFAAAENCRNRSLVLREAVNAKQQGLEMARVLSFAGNDEELQRLIRRAYESDAPANELEDEFYNQCIEGSRRRIRQL